MNALVVERDSTDIVLNDSSVENVVPVLRQTRFLECRQAFEFLLMWKSVADNFLLQEQLNG